LIIPANTFVELIEQNRHLDRSIVYLESEQTERRVRNGELWERALGILHHLQKLGARRGDKLILFLGNNEQFIDAFWAAVLGGIVPVPVALGISDEHRHKLFRIARKLGKAFLYTDAKNLERLCTRELAVRNLRTSDDELQFYGSYLTGIQVRLVRDPGGPSPVDAESARLFQVRHMALLHPDVSP